MVFKSKNKHPQLDRQADKWTKLILPQIQTSFKLVHVTFTTIKATLFTIQLNHDIVVYFSHIFFLQDFLNLLYIVLKKAKLKTCINLSH